VLLSYLFFLIFWYALVLYMLIFLFAPRFLPDSAHNAYLLFNSVFLVPLNGLVTYFFADFTWRWLGKPMPRLLKLGLPVPFAVILVLYAREMLGRLSTVSQQETFTISAPVSLALMFVCLVAVSLYAAMANFGLMNRQKGTFVLRFAAVTVGGLIVGVLFSFGAFSFLGAEWQNSVTSMVFAAVGVVGWVNARGSLDEHAHVVAPELADADLSGLENRYGISPRECEIISLMIRGKSNREITEALFISQETVKKHIYNVYRKIGVKNRVQLVNAVLESSASERPQS
jgi:DNA-binding CsgD family transcriptional regulator